MCDLIQFSNTGSTSIQTIKMEIYYFGWSPQYKKLDESEMANSTSIQISKSSFINWNTTSGKFFRISHWLANQGRSWRFEAYQSLITQQRITFWNYGPFFIFSCLIYLILEKDFPNGFIVQSEILLKAHKNTIRQVLKLKKNEKN